MKRVQQVLDIAKEMQGKDCDCPFAVIGAERAGKSIFTLNCDDYLGADINSVVVDKAEIGLCLSNLKDCGVFHFDECADGLLSKDAMTKWNRELERLFMIIGAKRLITFLLLPDFFLLSPYFRKHRIKGLFRVYKRGRVAFYDKKKIDKINFYHDKYKSKDIRVRPCFYDCFPKYDEGRMMKDYLKKKNAKVNGLINVFNEKMKEPPKPLENQKDKIINMLSKGWNPKDIAKKINTSICYISRIKNSCGVV